MTFLLLLTIYIGVILVFLVRSKLRADRLTRGCRQDATDAQIVANTFETGHSHTYYVTKDPDQYARIFVPDRAKK